MVENPQELLITTIGAPASNVRVRPTPEQVDELFDLAFENRVGLLFLERCRELGVALSPAARENHARLSERRDLTERMMIRLSDVLQDVARDRWVLFKSVKPFPSTPNDTDWFPFDRREHPALVRRLLESGFSFLERAPLQTTLIEDSGAGLVHSDKRGGIYYIDCYQAPSADYFIYLDPEKMRRHFTYREVQGHMLPALDACAELIAIMIHNVFPEKTFSMESWFLVLHYVAEIEEKGKIDDFVEAVRENFVERAVSANVALAVALHRHFFGNCPDTLSKLLDEFPLAVAEDRLLEQSGYLLPYNFSNRCFWGSFLEKLRDPVSLRSAGMQALHMLNPVFFADVMRIIWKRTRRGGIYRQM